MFYATRSGRDILKADTLALIKQGLIGLPSGRYGVMGPATDCWFSVRQGVPICTSGICEGRAVTRRSPDDKWLYDLRQIKRFLPLAAIGFTDASLTFKFPTKGFSNLLLKIGAWLKWAGWDILCIEPTLLEVKKADTRIPLPSIHATYRELSEMKGINPEDINFTMLLILWMWK